MLPAVLTAQNGTALEHRGESFISHELSKHAWTAPGAPPTAKGFCLNSTQFWNRNENIQDDGPPAESPGSSFSEQ